MGKDDTVIAMVNFSTEQQIQEELERQRQEDIQREVRERAENSPDQRPQGEPRGEEPISWFMFLCLMIISLIGDGVELFTAGTVGWFVGLAMDGVLLAILGFTKSGKKQFRRVLVGLFGELIPIINVLPLRTAFVIWAFMKSRSAIIQQTARSTRL